MVHTPLDLPTGIRAWACGLNHAILNGMVSDRLLPGEFVGRGAELSVFERAIAEARGGLPSVVMVGGDAGIGKTTIVSEAAARAGAVLLLGRSTHIGGDTIPLAPLADLLRQVRRSNPDLAIYTPDLAPLHHVFAPGTLAAEQLPSPQGALFVAVLELLTRLADDDVVLVGFDDLHWADTVTWDLFEYLARNLIDERVVLIGTFRSNETAAHPSQRRRLAELSRLPAAYRIHLEGLDRDDVAARVTAQLGSPAPSALVDQVMARGQGNPFFTRELVAAHLAGEAIPMVLSDLISAEIAGLDHHARRVVAAMATIGRATSHELLATTLDLAADELEAAVQTVIDARLLVVENATYRFRHPLVGEVAYAELLPPHRSRLHHAIAESLQRQSADVMQRADRAGELAFHLDLAGDSTRAFIALLAAADAAETVAPGAAFSHLERAFELWDVNGETATNSDLRERLWQAAELATSTVGNKRAVELARRAFALGSPPRGEPWGHERLGRYLWSIGSLDESRVEFARAAELLTGNEGAAVAAVFAGLGQAELMAGHYAAAQQWCEKVFQIVANVAENPAAWSMARRVLGIVQSNQGDPRTAVELCRESVVAATSAQTRALATVYLCVALVDAGEYQSAVNTCLDAVAEGQLTGLDEGFGGYFDALAAEALTRLGRWTEAAAVLARHPIPNTLPVGQLRVARADAMLAARRGDADQALRTLTEAVAQPVDGWHRSVLDAAVADVHLSLGNWNEALHASERGWNATSQTSVLWAARFAMFSVVAIVERTMDELASRQPLDLAAIAAKIRQRIDDARTFVEHSLNDPQRDTAAHLAHAEASLTRLMGSDPAAWAEAAQRWVELGDRWMTAAALLREAEAAVSVPGSADRAATSLRQAHRIASELHADPLLAEIEEVSRRTRISIELPTHVALDERDADRLGLTPRETEVLTLIAAGHTNRQIGDALFVSDKTASVHVSNILRKLGVSSRVDAAAVAQRLNKTSPDPPLRDSNI
jgi:DNA-binding CsgD family transcriptional regulator/tetratricopeptide (TPR) repeat protein